VRISGTGFNPTVAAFMESCPRCKATEKVYALKARPFHWSCKNADCGGRKWTRKSG
jgi:transposase-like protein